MKTIREAHGDTQTDVGIPVSAVLYELIPFNAAPLTHATCVDKRSKVNK